MHNPGARPDVAADGFWGNPCERAFFDLWVFNHLDAPLRACYCKNKEEKKRKYDQRVRNIEHRCFSPLVFSTAGGLGPMATTVYKRLASIYMYADKLKKTLLSCNESHQMPPFFLTYPVHNLLCTRLQFPCSFISFCRPDILHYFALTN